MNRCPTCGSAQPLEMSMRAKNGETLTMRSCMRCETRSWYADGEPVERAQVLRLANGSPDFVMQSSERRSPSGR